MRTLTLLKQNEQRKRLVLEALGELSRAWYLVRFRNFRSYADRLGVAHAGAIETHATNRDPTFLSDVRWSIEAVNRTAGGRFTCLMQGMAGKSILNKRGIANTLILGAKLKRDYEGDDKGKMVAHAWLRTGSIILVGGEASTGYLAITSYHSA